MFGRRIQKKRREKEHIFFREKKLSLLLVKNFFADGQSGQKIRAILLPPAHTNNTHAEEREKRERERGSTFSERKMSATPSASKASPQEVNAEEENVLASRDDEDEEGEEQEEQEQEQERGASVGNEEEQEECVVFFSLSLFYF